MINMATIWGRPKIDLKIGLELNEEEARALYMLCMFNIEDMLKILYTHMGERVVDAHKDGLMLLFKSSREPLGLWLSKLEKAKIVFISNAIEGE